MESRTLNGAIATELAEGVTELNGDNNKKKLDSEARATWKGKYNSTARNLVRMWWLTKFLSALLDNLVNND